METIETYIVRIYRRDPRDPAGMVGYVEKVGRDERDVFSNREELLEILRHERTGIKEDPKNASASP